ARLTLLEKERSPSPASHWARMFAPVAQLRCCQSASVIASNLSSRSPGNPERARLWLVIAVVTLGQPLQEDAMEFSLGKIGESLSEALSEERFGEGRHFKRLLKPLLGRHRSQDSQIGFVLRTRLGIHRSTTGRGSGGLTRN